MRAEQKKISWLVATVCFSNYLIRVGISTWLVALTEEVPVLWLGCELALLCSHLLFFAFP